MFSKIIFLILPLAIETTRVPPRPLGFIYGARSTNSALVEFDVYMGPLCPDSKAAFPTMVKLADHYGPDKLRFRMHLFPLLYHRNAFLVAMGTHSVDKMTNKNMTFIWAQNVYSHLDIFYDKTLTEDQVILKMIELAKSMGLPEVEFKQLVTNSGINHECRVEWIHGCSRGITSTPTFMINDVVVAEDDQANRSEADWIKIIDPILNQVQLKSCDSE
ncbi:Hypothetical predicted protein [Mytilus galloprovincialis]|uniref:Thioredoxin-like fold domain-containing protein n=1 Tax=Mytilus galloprovincialis TaxID=29158 RepID=A0A8B6GTL0_MYTGA|nr:Hypothetical predicted protein [Mytilus galloprovincialis]